LWRRRLGDFRSFLLVAVAVAMATATAVVKADTFGPVRYDPNSDQLIVTIIYDGTNPDHQFSIQWGRCRKFDQPGQPAHQIIVSLLDNQYDDAARTRYTKTVRVPLASLSCRPARVTLVTTPTSYGNRPGARASLDIP
ncbi:MAG: hypothetical protein ACRD1F_12550, partial [Terriglobales bacterium]